MVWHCCKTGPAPGEGNPIQNALNIHHTEAEQFRTGTAAIIYMLLQKAMQAAYQKEAIYTHLHVNISQPQIKTEWNYDGKQTGNGKITFYICIKAR